MGISLLMPLVGTTQVALKKLDKGTGSATFTRATTATRLNPDTNLIAAVASGDLREDGRQYFNLLTYSEQFDNGAWPKDQVSISANVATSPGGAVTADRLVENAVAGVEHILYPTTSLTGDLDYTFSIFAKAGERSWLLLQLDGRAGGPSRLKAWFNLSTGAVGTVEVGATAAIEAFTGGWYRCSITRNAGTGAATSYAMVSGPPGDTISAWNGDGASGIYLWGAQLEQGSSVTRYRKSGSSPIYAPKGALVEGQRTNLALYSEQFDNAYWYKEAITVGINAADAPDGTTTADKLIPDSGAASHFLYPNFTAPPDNDPLTHSIFMKAGEWTWGLITVGKEGAGSGRKWAYFDLSNGICGSVTSGATSKIEPVGNGWYRCSVSVADTGAGVGVNYYLVGPTTGNGVDSPNGDGSSGAYFWGAQREWAAFPSSYIPTTSAAVTRNSDDLMIQKTGNFGASSTIFVYAEYDLEKNPAEWRLMFGHNFASGFGIGHQHGGSRYEAGVGGGVIPLGASSSDAMRKYAIRLTNGRVAEKGVVYPFDQIPTLSADGLGVGCNAIGSAYNHWFYEHVKHLIIFDPSPTDVVMQAITAAV